MKKQILFLLLVTGLLFPAILPSQKPASLPKGITQKSSVEGITEYELENGLKVLLFPDQSKPTITVNITYLVGSRHEAYGETGMAHLLEHLVFKGTPRHPNIPQELTERGARPNGTTWYDRTNYYETFSATDDNLRWALDLEADRMINSFIAKKDLDSEMTVVRNEFESGENDPSGVLMERVLSTAYLWHNYGKSTIGCRADLENVPIERLQGFYRKYYQPDNAVLTVTGKFDVPKTLQYIDEFFAKIPRPERELIPTYTKEPVQDGERIVTLKRTGDVQVVSCSYHTPPGSHPDYAAISIIDELLTNEPSGRLYKALVESKKASYVWSFAPSLKESGFIYINATLRKENSLEDVKETLLATLDNLKKDHPTQEELDRAKARLLKQWNLSFNASDRVGLTISEYIAQGDWRLFFLYRDAIEKVTLEDVVNTAVKYFKPANRTLGIFTPDENPDRSEIPNAPDLASLVDGYKGKALISEGEAFDPAHENIDKRTVKGALQSGLKYAYITKENRGDAVNANITLRFGTPKTLVGKSVVGSFAASMLDKGTKNLNRQQIQDKLDELKARVGVYGSQSSAGFSVETTHDNLPEVLNLVGEIATSAVFPKDEFEKLKEERLAQLEEQLSDPGAVANSRLQKLLSPYPKSDARYVMTMQEEIEAIKELKYEEVVSFYKENYGASEATVSIVGDFDKTKSDPVLDKYFGKWKNPSQFERITAPYTKAEPVDENINTPDKANAMFFAGINLPVGDNHPDYPALVIGNFMLGGGFLNSRLATRIRQKEGLSYGVGSWFSGSNLDESGSFGAYAIYAPENRDKVQSAFIEEIQKVRTEGFTQEELDAARSGWIQSQSVGRAQDRTLVGRLATNLRTDRTMQWDKDLQDKIMKLSAADINKVMAKHLDPDKMIYVKAGDFDKAFNVVKP
ncbi:MAG: insulinase family protein [Saprospiraceae bacterium]|nr:insulinase family protein [Saprospiraceae bacterium]